MVCPAMRRDFIIFVLCFMALGAYFQATHRVLLLSLSLSP